MDSFIFFLFSQYPVKLFGYVLHTEIYCDAVLSELDDFSAQNSK